MPKAIVLYVHFVDAICRHVGRFAMYLIFVMLAVLLYSSYTKAFTVPALWTLEMAQFLMAAYYMLGGPYSMQMGDHVRMDLIYGSWSRRKMAFTDTLTSVFLVTYLAFLLYGGISSTTYAIQYNETSYSTWSPIMWPVKVVMVFGIALMLLQTTSFFFKDLAHALGMTLDGHPLAENEKDQDTQAEAGI